MVDNNIIPFPSTLSQSPGGDKVNAQNLTPTDPKKPQVIPKLADLLSMVCLLDSKSEWEAAKVAPHNWKSVPGFRWKSAPANEYYWALFPIDYDGSGDIVRESNWIALEDTLANYAGWQAHFLRFNHPDTTCLRVLGIQVGFGTPASLTPAFRLFHQCLDQLQKNIPIDEKHYQDIWEDEIKEQIRRLGATHVRAGEADEDISTYGTNYSLGWPTKVLRYIMNRSPELLSADIGKIPTIKEADVLTALKTMCLHKLPATRSELIGVGP